jgi:eukaryotic-like serine/threonine-protein kinase
MEMLLNACGIECVAMGKREQNQGWYAMYKASDGRDATAPVGSFPAGAGPFGAQDMAGNVGEWTADWYGPYRARGVTNPHGAPIGEGRVIRGDGWHSDNAWRVRGAHRSWDRPTSRNTNVGFRCARGD